MLHGEVRDMNGSPVTPDDAGQGAVIIYDGACPFCSAYVRLTRLQAAIHPVVLVDARAGGPEVDEVRRAGLDIDEGMVLRLGGRHYHGADCLNMLALLSTGSGLFNRVMSVLFRHPAAARIAYPVLAALRSTALLVLGRGRIA
jgi:predicted DCC family thiol-disulfide oxidoreductase YuxK